MVRGKDGRVKPFKKVYMERSDPEFFDELIVKRCVIFGKSAILMKAQ
jgi:hypothetical protein